jgi:hypothetical protein
MNKPSFVVEHVITADDPCGEPWPPDGSVSIVRRLNNGWTLWRRLHPPDSTEPSPSRPE